MVRDNKVVRRIRTMEDISIPRITWPALMFAAKRKDKVMGRM